MLVDYPFLILQDYLQVPFDQIKIITCFVLTIFLGYFQYSFLNSSQIRHLFSVTIGLGIALLQFGPHNLYNFAFTSLVSYLMLSYLPRKSSALPIFIFTFTMLSSQHIYRMITSWNSWVMDSSSLMMMLICKITSLAYSYQDSAILKQNPDKIPDQQIPFAIPNLPNILQYYSYLCFYPGLLIGPCFQYMDYYRFVHKKDEFANIPSPFYDMTQAILSAVIFSIFVVVFGEKYAISNLSTENFASLGVLQKLFVFNWTAVIMKMRYSSAWKFTEAAMISSGLGYTEKGKHRQQRAMSIIWMKTEFAWSAKEMIDHWNISIAIWIRRCVYNRILKAGTDPKSPSSLRKSVAQYLSYLFSAFWHGFYLSQYLSLILWSVHNDVSKMVYTTNWEFLPLKEGFKWAAWIMMWQIGNTLGMIFMLPDIRDSWKFITQIWYMPVVVLGSSWVFFKVTNLHRKR